MDRKKYLFGLTYDHINNESLTQSDMQRFHLAPVSSINEHVQSIEEYLRVCSESTSSYYAKRSLRREQFLQDIAQRFMKCFQREFFHCTVEGSILNEVQWNKLIKLNKKELCKPWSLLYRASRDGFHVDDFHRCCDNQGPTITIIRTRQGRVLGGYTAISWHSDESHFCFDNQAFLFSFQSDLLIKCALITGQNKYAVWNNRNYGPTFGRGADLFVCCQSNVIGESYSKFPSSYSDPTGLANLALAGQQQFFIDEIEIYH